MCNHFNANKSIYRLVQKACDLIEHNVLINKFHELVVHSLPGLIKCLHGFSVKCSNGSK